MTAFLKLASLLGLGLTVLPAFLVFTGSIGWGTHTTLMAVGTVVWFVTAPFWMHGEPPQIGLWKRRRPV